MTPTSHDAGGAEPPRRARHASKRRGPGPLWILGSGALVAAGVLSAMAALDSGPGGAAPRGGPAVDDGRPGMPALIQPDRSGAGDDSGDGNGDGDGDGDGRSASPGATSSGSASPSVGTASPTGPTPSAGATGAPTPTASGGASYFPGKSGVAPGAKKKQR
ncbi:hypothetical protein KV205_31290 [Streptomyces sp. SKN60]|uniref:hypothetical protein n=1 Tax=Streptomyces sp. SKN60 TaxID=2855506 RepID=UPI0022477F80|nr:hypothetical protein [Streptomyces sp. SKN60]MCX2184979.1 hypothetical protein [Streptomyces sp. SKN60]